MSRLLLAAAAALALLAGPAAAQQAWPTRPVRLIVPFPPGGATDIIARLVSEKLTQIWDRQVIVDYKPGAGTVVGTDVVAKAAPDGYTMGIVITAHVINPSLRSDLPYDTLKDLAGVSMVAVSDIAIVATPGLPANSIPELVAYAKANPGKLSYATPGSGTSMHLAMELLKVKTGIDLLHVPYRGGSPAYTDVFSGRVDLQADPMSASLANIKSGKVKILAIMSPARTPSEPQFPTVAEAIPGFDVRSISGIVVPAATPRDLVQKISRDLRQALEQPDLKERMGTYGMLPAGTTPEAFDQYVRDEIAKWSEVVKISGAKAD